MRRRRGERGRVGEKRADSSAPVVHIHSHIYTRSARSRRALPFFGHALLLPLFRSFPRVACARGASMKKFSHTRGEPLEKGGWRLFYFQWAHARLFRVNWVSFPVLGAISRREELDLEALFCATSYKTIRCVEIIPDSYFLTYKLFFDNHLRYFIWIAEE